MQALSSQNVLLFCQSTISLPANQKIIKFWGKGT